jgi:hypothetical protein
MPAALVRLQVRYDTAANWASSNPVLLAGEPGMETDTGRVKFGNGTSNWAALPYTDAAGLSSTAPQPLGSAAAGTSSLAARADHVHDLPTSLLVSALSTTGNVVVGGNLQVVGSFSTGSTTINASSVIGLSEAVDDRVAALVVAGSGVSVAYNDTAGTLTIGVATHTHAIADITGLVTALAGKAATTHTHVVGDVTGLSGELAARPTSTITGITGAVAITNIVSISQANYDSLSPKSPTTLYVIT